MNTHSTEESPALRLARYLKEYVGIRSTTVADVEKYDECLWFSDMPQERDCFSPLWTDGEVPDGPWLLVKKQRFEPAPVPPDITQPWIDDAAIKRATSDFPELRSVAHFPAGSDGAPDVDKTLPATMRHLSDHPEIQQAYEKFRPVWEAWAVEQRRREAIQRVYSRLFRLHTQVLKQGELIEIVLGLGLLDWRAKLKEASIRVRRHVLVARVDLRFDPTKGEISIVPPGEGALLRIEDDMLEADLRPDISHYEAVELQLQEIADAFYERAAVHEAIQTWAGALSADSEYSEKLQPLRGSGRSPLMSFAPAIILRKRTQAGMLRIYTQMIEQLLKEDANVPDGWRQLVEDMDDAPGGSADEPSQPQRNGIPKTTGEIYFPLPANREQRRIIEAVNRHRGVLVQGPPGTGKSHTIANLMCHLLATGKRILVTAESARALQVLKSKLPEGLQPLCVSLMGQESDSFAELERAVRGITIRQASHNPETNQEQTRETEVEIDAARRQLAELDTEILSLREGETTPHALFNNRYTGTPSSIAARVAQEAPDYNWLALQVDAPQVPPLSNDDMLGWLTARRKYTNQQFADAHLGIPEHRKLQTPAEFATLVALEKEAATAVETTATAQGHVAYLSLRTLDVQARDNLRGYLRNLERQRVELLRGDIAWVKQCLSECLIGQRARWQTLSELTEGHLGLLSDHLLRLGRRVVALPQDLDPRKVRVDAEAAMVYLQQGGKWKQLGLITPAPLRGRTYLRDRVRVDGQGAGSPADLRAVCEYLDKESLFAELHEAWRGIGLDTGNGDVRTRIAMLQESLATLVACLKYVEICQRLMKSMAASTPPVPEPNWLNGEAGQWLTVIDALVVEQHLEEAKGGVRSSGQALAPLSGLHDTHPVVSKMLAAIDSRDIQAYSEAYTAILAIEETRVAEVTLADVESFLKLEVPWLDLLQSVANTVEDAVWDTRLAAWEQAWYWCLADAWLTNRQDAQYKQQLWVKRVELEAHLGQLISRVAELRAWAYFFARLTPAESAALRGWQVAMKAQKKGKRNKAKLALLKNQARQLMEICRDAIPIWIMPRYLVAEMTNVAPNRYDLVIVDEASQLGIESLFLFYLAKKMVVVGDDQQISPSGVGIADDSIAALQNHYLKDFKYCAALSPQSSLYANAKIRFNQNIVLREHFRCMPEIIQFSNDLCYAINGTPLDPLRTYAGNRLKPLVLRHVPAGYREGSSQYAQNPPEADAIVAQIVACCKDPRYSPTVKGTVKKLTMGVISLQGEAQSQLIERKLLQALDSTEINERRIICGDAYAFQGDERHIIFLSMVAAPPRTKDDTRIGALANDAARQRFNVAASRAQDQLWLFHSAQLDTLSRTCMRYHLLSYMLDPSRQANQEENLQFDSEFERDVYRIITARGYHVRTQVGVGDRNSHRYRIDLVVEGMQGQLAVECDGDKWHGADRYEADMARQRDLERAGGWQFVRIRGGDFYRNAERAMDPLWQELERLGILPGGIDENAAEPPRPEQPDESSDYAGAGDDPDDEAVDVDTDEEQENTSTSFQDDDLEEEDELHSQQKAPSLSTASAATQANPLPLRTVSANSAHTPLQDSLPPYIAFEGAAGPDPRAASVDEVAAGLCRIISVEGPMLAKRAYILYLRGCDIKRMGKELHRTMNQALSRAIQRGNVVSVDEWRRGGVTYTIVRTKGTSPLRLRQRGPRDFSEIPASELHRASQLVADRDQLELGSEAHLRAVLDFFDLKRLTTQVSVTLSDVVEHFEVAPAPPTQGDLLESAGVNDLDCASR